ncbi:MAG: 4Fe-4S dicluster domain-containing protein [Thermoplasmata archaeon]
MSDLTDQMSSAESSSEVSELERRMLREMREETPDYCLQCVKCTAGCPAMKLLELHPHEVMALFNLGFTEELLKSEVIWCCVTCFKCKERCPQKVTPVDVILLLRSIAVQRGLPVPPGFAGVLQAVIEKGLIQDPVEVLYRSVATGKKRFTDRKGAGLGEASRPVDMEKFREALTGALCQSLLEDQQ